MVLDLVSGTESRKVSWKGGDPTGHWSENMVEHGELPEGTDATKPVICITFQHKGNETLATIPIYGAVYRAIGTIIGRSRVYIVLIEGDA